jgi:hypothetical protein
MDACHHEFTIEPLDLPHYSKSPAGVRMRAVTTEPAP